ncbi:MULTISPECIES: DEAD/DEAH box helicase [Aeribacillus]|uniref:DEAD/DEAH box helicase n=1 Tax=Aeribacillus TaxID=1055323 RepID=UPI0007B4C64F|nr:MULTISPECIES: DEAD/DEAH box helicase [Aeribacillus]KZM52656.1 ATP-dependent helicase [Aeribacillus pallidus]MED0648996.1 DEAD/DEAH box helicase [Aeribacillus composti]MED0703741.1 DEAD/DEAH box helicase [Aeribacillus composti]MED4486071.1 DEAD/DEAH box helicase [Aeribacillus pallidus]
MLGRKPFEKVIHDFRHDERFRDQIVYWHTIPEKEAITVPFPEDMDNRLKEMLKKKGIEQLYSHQKEAFELALNHHNIVAVTPTASGKTLCYNLPVLNAILKNNNTRALYLFPTKALAQDQKSELNEWIEGIKTEINCYTYDGDTSPTIRQKIRKAGHIVMTNPDMLHSGILPHHTKWVSLFENLKYVVIDELHTYRGVFGSHVANVIRRLKRICRFYGSDVQFICTSATIANPLEFAETLIGEKAVLIDRNGAPRSKKHFIFYNPPVVNKPLNIRRSAMIDVKEIAKEFLKNDIQTIVFARSRTRVEIILTYLQEMTKKELGSKTIRGYRGGYLPKQRREIEKGLREGKIKGVVSTNALELGVDIGQLQVCIMTGYPGSIASAWQQSGRAGRREEEAAIILVGGSSPLDQYILKHPEYLFEKNPESAIIHPDNLIILVDHIKCAAFELPFQSGETLDGVEVDDILDFLKEEGVLYENGGRWYWMSDSFPAHGISLRSASQENVVIIDTTNGANVIGEMDRFSAMTMLHEEAIYLHEGRQFQVEKLDWEEKKAYVSEVNVDYFTDANLAVQLKVLEVDQEKESKSMEIGFGDVMVLAQPTIFKKIKFGTHENIGSGPIHLPEEELHTTGAWISFKNDVFSVLSEEQMEKALVGISHALKYVSALAAMCDPNDLDVVFQVKSIHNGKPTIYLYDRYPGGVGLAKKVFDEFECLLERTEEMVTNCKCDDGCPSCIGLDGESSGRKEAALLLLQYIKKGQILCP